ncbi:hypothetical protein TKK_0016464 [Trichogramma kaykai]|uniref:tRNA (34-2'-O)-methyltransferase regulator WDR6 n=1 Tax=Trichogramma kaykai TaxID=54128 RepID=A0ABD2W5T6_9HYME
MKFFDLTTDVLAIKCHKNHVFIGIGCSLYVVSQIDNKVKFKSSILHPDNIHDIKLQTDDRIIIYGRKSLCICQVTVNDGFVEVIKLDEIHHFNDWIIDVKCLGSVNEPILTILFAHNNVYNYNTESKKYSNTICKETCLLYAGEISGKHFTNAIVLSGTVFQEILIWSVLNNATDSYSPILHRLKGHKGVIFSVFYNPMNNIICSTSDDRTVRLWKISNNFNHNLKDMNWSKVEINLQTTMYGHLARVWKAILIKDVIASIGEDSRICFWNLSGELLHKIEAHQGATIWCIDISVNNILFTGGADGSVNCWSMIDIKSSMSQYSLLEDSQKEVPKHVIFLENSDVLVYSSLKSNTRILHYKKNKNQILDSFSLPEFSSAYCIMELSPNRQKFALASIRGDIILYNKSDQKWNQCGIYKIMESKIFSVQWLDNDRALVCSTEGNLSIVKFIAQRIEILSQHILPPSRERWVTSACTHKNLLICGDRMGSIFVYNLNSDSRDPTQTFKKIHGRLGVQSCTMMNGNLVTTGRDGTLRFYRFCDMKDKTPIIEYLYAKSMPMDWVSKLLRHENDYYVLGFKEEDFVVYSVVLKRILVKFPCGGGHRSWDCLIYNNFINFAFIKKRKIEVYVVPFNKLFIPPLLVGCHTKEIYAVKTLRMPANPYNVLISGGEDCRLVIHFINSLESESKLNLEIVDSFDGHLSSIKCLSIFPLKEDEFCSKYLIFSGGGRAQIKIWEVTVNNDELFSKENISCKDLFSYMLHGPDKERNKIWVGKELMYNADPETRYMDISTIVHPKNMHNILVFIACSDGYLRTFIYDIILNKIKLVHTLPYRNRCILKVQSMLHQAKILLITMATDGLLNFWTCNVENDEIDVQKIGIENTKDFTLHQSGINSFDLKKLDECNYMLATGGDDNLLGVLIFKAVSSKKSIEMIKIVSTWNTSSIHYAQITGVKLLTDNKLISVGADQKLAVHDITCHDLNIHAMFVEDITLCISDIQGITFCDNKNNDSGRIFCVYGKGYQLLEY